MKQSGTIKCALLLVLLAHSFLSTAQQQHTFRYTAVLNGTQGSGFYSITLPPAIIARCNAGCQDIRLKNSAGKEAPYLLQQATAWSGSETFISFPVIQTKNGGKSVVIQSGQQGSISELFLFIKNNEATRQATLSGSDDSAHWYVIKENIYLQSSNNSNSDTFMQRLTFPPVHYPYYQVTITGKDVLPVNIVKAGIYNQTTIGSNTYEALPSAQVTQKDSSNKRSYITLLFDAAYKVDKLECTLAGAPFFYRAVQVFDASDASLQLITSQNISSVQPLQSISLHTKTRKLLLVINNQDNAALQLTTVQAFQLPVSLITYLDSGNRYSIFFGDSLLQKPMYDLPYFSDTMQHATKRLTVGSIQNITPANTSAAAGTTLNKWVLWCIIAAVLLLLVWFSYSLLKDINKKTNNDAHL